MKNNRFGVGRLGCTAGLGCFGLIGMLLLLSGLTIVFMIQQNAATSLPISPLVQTIPAIISTALPAIVITPDDSNLLVVTTISQPAPASASTVLVEPSPTRGSSANITPTATPAAPVPYQPFFGGQTQSAQQSMTAMLAARTNWYGSLTQGAVHYVATLRALGTPINLTATAVAGSVNQP